MDCWLLFGLASSTAWLLRGEKPFAFNSIVDVRCAKIVLISEVGQQQHFHYFSIWTSDWVFRVWGGKTDLHIIFLEPL